MTRRNWIARLESPGRLALRTARGIRFVKLKEIDWIEAKGKYCYVHVGTESIAVRESIGVMEQVLDRTQFIRIHRSTIVNIDRIRELRPWLRGEYRVILVDGTELLWSRSYKRAEAVEYQEE